jgi:anti-sigma B factor antagonist
MQTELSLIPLEAPLRGLRLVGELDMGSARDLTDTLSAMSGDGDVRLELSGLEFIDSSGLHALVQYAGSLDGDGDNLILANPSEMTARVFEIAEFAKHPRIVIEVTSGE